MRRHAAGRVGGVVERPPVRPRREGPRGRGAGAGPHRREAGGGRPDARGRRFPAAQAGAGDRARCVRHRPRRSSALWWERQDRCRGRSGVRPARRRAPVSAPGGHGPRPEWALRSSSRGVPGPGHDRRPRGRGRASEPGSRPGFCGFGGSYPSASALPSRRAEAPDMKLSERFDRRYQQTPLDLHSRPGLRRLLQQLTEGHFRAKPGLGVTTADKERLVETLFDEVVGLGPLETLLRDPDITEVMVNRPEQIFVERRGRIELTNLAFEDEDSLRRVIDRIVSSIGRRVDESEPMCDARLKDGSRVNVVIPPGAIYGPCLTIRKFGREVLTPEKIVAAGGANAAILE